jgi:hypothetical protein
MAMIVDDLPLAERPVNVRGYLRCWQGVWQTVRAHTQGWPRRKRAHHPN